VGRRDGFSYEGRDRRKGYEIMTVAELIVKLQDLPADFDVLVGSGSLAAIWVSESNQTIDLDYGNGWHESADGNPTYAKVWDASPGEIIQG
jgi:hypothetical protein